MRNLLKRHLPNKEKLEKQGHLKFLSKHLHDPNIWHLHRRSAAGGAAIGAFCAFIPFPVQSFLSAIFAIYFRVNLPVALIFSLISNPLTIPFMFFYTYKTGAWLLGIKELPIKFELSWEWFSITFLEIWQPLLLGCFIYASISSILVYSIVRLIWRVTAINKWLNRRREKKIKQHSEM
ncbi:MAG: DUF2062 domain-containing protein [Pseudomonadota bacterium]